MGNRWQWRRVSNRPGIEFNAHCYQRREDATRLYCLGGLVTAGDIINRPFMPHRSFLTGHSVVANDGGNSLWYMRGCMEGE